MCIYNQEAELLSHLSSDYLSEVKKKLYGLLNNGILIYALGSYNLFLKLVVLFVY